MNSSGEEKRPSVASRYLDPPISAEPSWTDCSHYSNHLMVAVTAASCSSNSDPAAHPGCRFVPVYNHWISL